MSITVEGAPAAPSAPQPAIGHAQAALRQATARAEMEGDPLRPVLAALSASLGAMDGLLAQAEAHRQPLDAKERAEMVRQVVQVTRADLLRLAGLRARRLAIMAGAGAATLLLSAVAIGYLSGQAAERSGIQSASAVIQSALSDGAASGQVWAEAIRRNDLPALLQRCQGEAVWTDVSTGRRVCAVPLWLDDDPHARPAGPQGP
ncbi:hypothetical protein [Roseomonas sp. KE0001]|uniref:hypothetical protein n=1 Tax=Roseomonas sp. KE0001 TaxID=2479201 RepID=UPI0018E01AC7|nr:hypothetical protein [Roseomonas sp. KE0001]MBI0435863.1 hypothetical protein [Roseomonas sp. KE0001]